jgi:hypothetical protein
MYEFERTSLGRHEELLRACLESNERCFEAYVLHILDLRQEHRFEQWSL